MSTLKIPYLPLNKLNALYEPALSEAIARVVRSGRYLRGEATERFEQAFADYCGAPYCVGVGNGLDALTLALDAYASFTDSTDCNKVVVPTHTFIASARAISRAGLAPVFADIHPVDFLLDTGKLSELLTEDTLAVMPVHLYGKLCQMDSLNELASKKGIAVIEDAAQAHGAKDVQGRRAGGFGNTACFSFYPGKNLGGLGDGGAIVLYDRELTDYVRCVANYGSEKKYEHIVDGCNSRLDEIQAAVLHVKLQYLDADNARRRELAARYQQGITHPSVTLPYGGEVPDDCVFHIFPIRCIRRNELQTYLYDKGIETLLHYPLPVHKQKAFMVENQLSFPVSEQVACEELSLPLHPALTDSDADYIIEQINTFSL